MPLASLQCVIVKQFSFVKLFVNHPLLYFVSIYCDYLIILTYYLFEHYVLTKYITRIISEIF